MRGCALTWPFCFGVRLGWASARTPNPDPQRARGRVYLLRGQAVIFSRGFGTMCARFREAGLWAEDLRCVGDRWVRRHLRTDQERGLLQGPVILVGHSCGGRYALFTARELARWGIRVELLVCIDVAMPFRVAANVGHAVHLYRSKSRLYPARPLEAEPGSSAQVRNIDLDDVDSPIASSGLHHLNITASLPVQSWVVERVFEAVATADDSCPPGPLADAVANPVPPGHTTPPASAPGWACRRGR